MRELIERINTMTEQELQDVMRIIENRYRQAYPEWDVVFISLHKDPQLRRQELEGVLRLICGCTEWYIEKMQPLS